MEPCDCEYPYFYCPFIEGGECRFCLKGGDKEKN